MDITVTDRGLLRLLQLTSASLPVGGYAFSQGLEYAIDEQWLRSSAEVRDWLQSQLQHSMARVDIPILLRLLAALREGDNKAVMYWNSTALACRETRELLLTDTAMGLALIKLLRQLNVPNELLLCFTQVNPTKVSFVTAFAIAAHHWHIDDNSAALGLLWSWLDNQVAAATKLVPLGQTQAQCLLSDLQQEFTPALLIAQALDNEQLGSTLPALAIASAKHEIQYSRLFRS